eukprot:TRINITY_DN17548_c0_g1_i1.p1 TRINITY_DN17548_c0_g1~~TRINITY_DN17548_c0_g1_i1.p1  ORF type:complete len:223 (-),score=35.27 TRINITY_DN17548_c0_g1_i1:19-687(-)
MMNIFRIIGDLLHLMSIFILLLQIKALKSCKGVSLKTQILYAIVFTSRYTDLFWNRSSLYNTIFKLFFLGATYYILYLMLFKYNDKYEKKYDTFRIEFIIPPCLILAFFLNFEFTPYEVVWAFSIYLESLAILPQLFMLVKTNNTSTLTLNYIFCLGAYRAVYIINWIYRAFTETGYGGLWIVWISGLVQTGLYIDFFYYYLKSKWYNDSFNLPGQEKTENI